MVQSVKGVTSQKSFGNTVMDPGESQAVFDNTEQDGLQVCLGSCSLEPTPLLHGPLLLCPPSFSSLGMGGRVSVEASGCTQVGAPCQFAV